MSTLKFLKDKYLNNFKKGIHGCDINNLDYFPSFSIEERSRSYVKVQDGCNYPCTYCTIPLARGKSRSDFIKNRISKNSFGFLQIKRVFFSLQ